MANMNLTFLAHWKDLLVLTLREECKILVLRAR